MSGPADQSDESENGLASTSLPRNCDPGPCTDVEPSGLTAPSCISTASLPPLNVTEAGPSVPSVGSTNEGTPDSTVLWPSWLSTPTEPVWPSQMVDPSTDTHEFPPVPDCVMYRPPGPKVRSLRSLSPLATTVARDARLLEDEADTACGTDSKAIVAV